MAQGTITGQTSNQYIEVKVEWSSEAIPEDNQSKVTANLYYRRTNTGYTTYGNGDFSITIGDSKKSYSGYVVIDTDWVLVMSYSTYVDHDADGQKRVMIYASGKMPATTLQDTSLSYPVDLDTIPRASSVSASNVTLGNKCKVTWTPHSSSFRFKIKFSLGGWSYTTGYISPATTSSYTYTGYTIPFDAAEQITGGKTGTMTATLYTYMASVTVPIGSASDTFTVTVPTSASTMPTVTMTLAPVSSLGSPFNSYYIQGYSRVKATL
jgi:hypothetical protein